jgi:hypothetical protein
MLAFASVHGLLKDGIYFEFYVDNPDGLSIECEILKANTSVP